MLIEAQLKEMDAMVSSGQILEAVQKFFHDDALTDDVDGTKTSGKQAMVQKMTQFLGGIQKVNGITLHYSVSGDDVSMSEYTFDFDMKDGSKILWHEVIRRVWKDGKVIDEQYFQH